LLLLRLVPCPTALSRPGPEPMGYVARRTYRLQFADETYAGMEVDVTSPSLDEYFRLLETRSTRDMESFRQLLATMAEHLVRWNLEDETGEPVPATEDGLLSVDLDIITAVLDAWTDVLSGASGPLGRKSSSGGTSPELSTPGPGSLSESQLSSLATSSLRQPA
jgi:hypothetical protein